MADRKIKLVIDVKDEDVVKASSSLNRLEKAAKDVGKSGNEINKVEDSLNGVASSAGGLAAAFNPVTAIIAAGTVAVTAFATAILAATRYAFELSKSFAEYGAEIFKAQQITSLTAETLSTLKIEVEKLGGSFESVIDGVKDYATKIADAAKGSKDAEKDLNSLGINGKKYLYDFQGGLEAAFTAINRLPPGVAQMSAATKLFGEEAARNLIPIIRKADGDISKLIENLKDFGVVLSEEDVQASREFNKVMGEMQMELRGVGLTLGRELLPVARDVFREFSGFYKENKVEIKEWAVYIADIFRGAIEGITKLVSYIKENWGWISTTARVALGIGTLGTSEVSRFSLRGFGSAVDEIASAGKASRENSQSASGSLGLSVNDGSNYFKPDAGKEQKFQLSSKAKSIVDAAGKLGVSPLDLATIISYETSGTFNPNIKGGKGGNYQGAIQFGPDERKQFGVYAGQSFENQMTTSVIEYFKTRFNSVGRTTQGATLLDLYKTVNGGNPNVSSEASDGFQIINGVKVKNTISGHVAKMSGQHRSNAISKMFGGSISNIPSNTTSSNDYESQIKNIIDLDNKAFVKERFEKLSQLYQGISAITPPAEFIKSYTDFLNKDIPLDRNKLTTLDVSKRFEKQPNENVVSQGGDISTSAISFRPTLGDDYLKFLNETLDTQTKINQVVGMREKHEEAINALVADAMADQDLQIENLGNQYEIQQKLFGDETYRQYAQDIQNLEEKLSLESEVFDIENKIANGGINDSLKIKAAYLKDVVDLREREVDAVIQINRAELELSQKNVFSQNQANAQLYDYLNRNIKSVTDSYVDFKTTIADGALQQIDSPFERLRQKLEKLPPIIKGLASAFVNLANDIVRAFSQKIISQILGVGGGSNASQGSSGGFSVANLFQQTFGGGGGAGGQGGGGLSIPGFSGGTLNFPSNNLAFAGAGSNAFRGDLNGLGFSMPTGSISNGAFNVSGGGGSNIFAGNSVNGAVNAATSQLSSYSKFKSLFSGKGNLLGSIAPMLGMSLGSMAGGQSAAGQILGSIGGLAGGLLGGIGTGAINATTMLGGIFGSGGALSIGGLSAAMSATVVLAPIAGALLIGSLLLKRNSARRRDETTRDKLMLDTLADLNKIKAEMEAAKPGVSVQSLLDQTGEISANYFTQANALKDKKTKGIAIKDGNERVGVVPPNSQFPNALTNQIYAASQAAKAKEDIRSIAGERDRRMLPEFATGGFIPAKRGGHLAVVGEGGFDEFILSTDPKYASRTAKLLSSFIDRMNFRVPKMAAGGISNDVTLSQSNSSSNTSAFSPRFTFIINNKGMVESDIQDVLINGLKDPDVQVEVVKAYDTTKPRQRGR